MRRFDDWVADPAITLPSLHEFMADLAPHRRRLPRSLRRLGRVRGRAASPVFVQDARAMAVYDALEALRRHTLRPLRRMFDPLYLSERLAFVGAIGGHFASVVSLERLRRLNPWMSVAFHSVSILQPTAAIVEQLNALAPTILVSYPTAVALLAEQACRGAPHHPPGRDLDRRRVLTDPVRHCRAQLRLHGVQQLWRPSGFLSIGWGCARAHARQHRLGDPGPVDEQHRPVAPAGRRTTLLTNWPTTCSRSSATTSATACASTTSPARADRRCR